MTVHYNVLNLYKFFSIKYVKCCTVVKSDCDRLVACLDDVPVSKVRVIRDLGVHIDNHFEFDYHMYHMYHVHIKEQLHLGP